MLSENFALILKILSILILSGLLYWLLTLVNKRLMLFLSKAHELKAIDSRVKTFGKIIISVGGLLIFLVSLLMIMKELNIDIGPLLTGAGIAGLVISLSSQAILKDMFAGILILAENQFSEGTKVKLDDAEGTVEKIYLRKTILKDAKGNIYHVPNGQIKITKIVKEK